MKRDSRHRRNFLAMSSQCEILVEGMDREVANKLVDSAIQEVARIEAKYSRYLPNSFISKLNAQAGRQAVQCDDETSALLDFAGALYQTSEGLFDATSGILRKAWSFRKAELPGKEQLEPLLDLIGWDKVERDGKAIRLSLPGMEMDFGGFGKEYAADRAALVLSSGGVKHGYVNMAGDIRVIGPREDGSPWYMGIQHPRDASKMIATIPLHGGALATSGDYERYIEVEGKRYCHILNPFTGYPCTLLQSVSILAPLAVMSGGYATIAMLKENDAISFLDESGLVYLVVDEEGNVHDQTGRQQINETEKLG